MRFPCVLQHMLHADATTDYCKLVTCKLPDPSLSSLPCISQVGGKHARTTDQPSPEEKPANTTNNNDNNASGKKNKNKNKTRPAAANSDDDDEAGDVERSARSHGRHAAKSEGEARGAPGAPRVPATSAQRAALLELLAARRQKSLGGPSQRQGVEGESRPVSPWRNIATNG